MLLMNQTLKDVLDKLKLPTVNYLGKFQNFYELVQANYEDMLNGMGEGLVLVSDNKISKWKNGSEANSSNSDFLTKIMDKIEKDNSKFGENTEKALELFKQLENIQKSILIMGEKPQPKDKEAKKKGGNNKAKVELTAEKQKEYDEAIKSAKSKFDHADTFFEKGMKGTEEYAKLIAQECLTDIKAENVDEHNKIVTHLIKEEFIEFNRAKKANK